MKKQYNEKRPNISADIIRTIEVNAGHKCTIKNCNEHTYLEIHHINGNREDNKVDNLILLCDKHHKMAHANKIDRKALNKYKKLLNTQIQHYETMVDDNFYTNLVDDFKNQIKNIGFQWLHSLPNSDWALKIDDYNKLHSLLYWINTRDWTANNSNVTLNFSFQKLYKNINLTLKTFELHLTTVNDYYVTEKFYKSMNFDSDQKLRTELEKQYDTHIDKLIDLTVEVAESFNEVLRNIRKEVDDSFLLNVGIISSLHGRKLA
jgi:hypothetical protein